MCFEAFSMAIDNFFNFGMKEKANMSWSIGALIETGSGNFARIPGCDFEYTYNTDPMLKAVGIDLKQLNGKELEDVVTVLRTGLDRLVASPNKYEPMNPANGWGDYEDLCQLLTRMIIRFSKHPKAVLTGHF